MRRAVVLLSLAVLLVACSRSDGSTALPPAPTAPTLAPATSTTDVPAATLLAAGDIASCSSTGDEATAALLAGRPNAQVATLGDNVYESGTPAEFANCYDPTWGKEKARTHPALGNQEYGVFRAGGYFAEFGAAAGDSPLGWYSYDLGSWHVVVLNSNCDNVGCATGGSQETWLRTDLAAHPNRCTLAIWHHPRFSSGTTYGSNANLNSLYTALYDTGVDVLLTAHESNYERFAPLNPAGQPDDAHGVREFVVGTGGRSHLPLGPPLPGSEVRNDNTFGILALTLRSNSYQWQFVPEAGKSFTDSGSTNCH
ncbi:MAG TPA: metallophosphoesterase [Acidimicrobiales bacterium]|nr:metallophosphoesterase [Acidimicrobiales bacterium]